MVETLTFYNNRWVKYDDYKKLEETFKDALKGIYEVTEGKIRRNLLLKEIEAWEKEIDLLKNEGNDNPK